MKRTLKKTILSAGLAIIALSSANAQSWTESIKLKGDLRYRHEYIDQEGKLERNRQRIRARIALEGKIHSDVKVLFQLATGSSDPVSTNQSLDGGLSTKGIGLDIAQFSWKPASAEGFNLTGGKIKTPFVKPGKAELLWDGDLRPEGITASYQSPKGSAQFFLIAAGFWLEESSSGVDAGLRAVQGGVKVNTSDSKSYIKAGAGYFDYSNLEGRPTVFDDADSFGNSLDPSDNYMYDFNLLELFVEVGTKANSTPLTIFGDFVTNNEPDSNNTAWLVGAKIGKAKKTGSWEGRYNYRKVEMDAVLGVFTDSDFRGGGTNGQGHEFGLNVMAASKIKLGASLFINERDLVAKTDFTRLQIDANFKL